MVGQTKEIILDESDNSWVEMRHNVRNAVVI